MCPNLFLRGWCSAQRIKINCRWQLHNNVYRWLEEPDEVAFPGFVWKSLEAVKIIVDFYEEFGYTTIMKGVVDMPNIKSVSDLRNYGEVLRDVAVGQPVFLTKNGHGRYAVLDMEEYRQYEVLLAKEKLLKELEMGRRSGENGNWLAAEDVFRELEEGYNG